MRPLYVDISGTLDSKGNATIPVRVPRMTGNWHNARLILSTSAPARWTALVNGRPHDFRPGVQASLGPVLVQDGETVAVQVTGGPPGGTVDGTCTGVSGLPNEVMASFVPSPGAIAVDTTSRQVNVGQLSQIAGGAAVNLAKQPVPDGTQSIGFVVESNVFPASIVIQGDQTLFNYTTTQFLNAGPYWFQWDAKDTTVSFQMTPTALNGCTVDFFASPLVQANGNPSAVAAGQPALWQAANMPPVQFSVVLNAGVAMVIVTATPGQSVYLFCLNSTTDTVSAVGLLSLQDTAGTGYHVSSNNSNTNPGPALFAGGKLPSALGAQIKNIGTASLIARGSLAYSQGSP